MVRIHHAGPVLHSVPRARARQQAWIQDRGQGDSAKTRGGTAEDGTARNGEPEFFEGCHDKFLVMVSCKLRITRARDVQAARSATSRSVGKGASQALRRCLAACLSAEYSVRCLWYRSVTIRS